MEVKEVVVDETIFRVEEAANSLRRSYALRTVVVLVAVRAIEKEMGVVVVFLFVLMEAVVLSVRWLDGARVRPS